MLPSPNVTHKTTSILIFERHALLREALRRLIGVTDGLEVVGEAGNVDDAVSVARELRPDVVLMDGRADGEARDAAVVALKNAAPSTCVLMLADDAPLTGRTLADCIPREAGVRQFCSTIADRLGVHCAGCAIRPVCNPQWDSVTLSRRETHVAVRVASGLSSKQIAGQLGVSLRTIHTYRESLARKLGSSSAAVVTRYVIERGVSEQSVSA